MSSAKGKLARLFGGVLLRRGRVLAADDVAAGFRRLALTGSFPKPAAGSKLQILLPSDDMRTYSPIPSAQGMTLLGSNHGRGPGARWLSEVTAGADVRFIGPQTSLALPAGAVILVGDETSVAVAASFEAERPGKVHAIFQATSPDDTRKAAEAVGLRPVHAASRGDTSSIVDAVLSARASHTDATVTLTGSAELVLSVRAALRTRGIVNIKTKTYWIPGKVGLD